MKPAQASVERVYQAALQRDAATRSRYLDDACAGDSELREAVESLLAPVPDSFLKTGCVAEMLHSDLVGQTIGVYRVMSVLGAGGMGEVYRARDSKLGREVAIKVLPPLFAADRERLARFDREARMLAALNHPHIGAIYGVEEAGGCRALVLELVEGETLAEKLTQGSGLRAHGLPLPDALGIALQIVDALEAAHEKGIVHRDLKPANVKVTPEGAVKVLDFGLAKIATGDASTSDLTHSSTVTVGSTHEGTILGTVAYMSPEQARGQAIDKRTDIWAFGCVLFEMLTGRMAFPGDTFSDTIAAILECEPAWDRLPDTTPPAVRRLLRRCLEKDPKRRLRDIGDVRPELEEALAGPAHLEPGLHKPVAVTRREAIGSLVGATIGAAVVGGVAISRYRGATLRNVTRFAIAMPEGEFHQASFNSRIGISRDGTRIAFNTVAQGGVISLYTRSLSDLESTRVKEVVSGAAAFFSPDGRWLGFFITSPTTSMRKVALSGGAPVMIFNRAASGFAGATWADDDSIYFVSEIPGGLMSVPAAGGQPKGILNIDPAQNERALKFPCVLPGGRAVLYTLATAESESFDDALIGVFSPRTGQKKVLVEGGTHPRYSPSGHLVYARNGKLLAVRFDPDRLVVTGQPFTVVEGVLMSRNTGAANFDISSSGDLAYIPGICEGGVRTLFWVDRSGQSEALPLPPGSYLHPRISPDARKLAIEIEGANHDCYVYDFVSGVLSNITADGVSHWPLWSPDGQRIGYRSGVMGHFRLWQVPADRSHAPEQVLAPGFSQNAESYSPDGHIVAYTVMEPGAPSKVIMVELQGDRNPKPLDDSKYAEGSPKFSPDGRWVAYCSTESGKPQVYVQAFPAPGPKIQVSNDGGTDPVWTRSGGELFYRHGDSMMAVPLSAGPAFAAGRPKELWKGHYSHGMSSSCGPAGFSSSNYDVTPDGQRFLMIKDNAQDSATSKQVVVVLGWSDELNRLSKA